MHVHGDCFFFRLMIEYSKQANLKNGGSRRPDGCKIHNEIY